MGHGPWLIRLFGTGAALSHFRGSEPLVGVEVGPGGGLSLAESKAEVTEDQLPGKCQAQEVWHYETLQCFHLGDGHWQERFPNFTAGPRETNMRIPNFEYGGFDPVSCRYHCMQLTEQGEHAPFIFGLKKKAVEFLLDPKVWRSVDPLALQFDAEKAKDGAWKVLDVTTLPKDLVGVAYGRNRLEDGDLIT